MDETGLDIQRWLQLLVDKKLTLLEFFVLGKNIGLTNDMMLKRLVGMEVTVRIPVEKK